MTRGFSIRCDGSTFREAVREEADDILVERIRRAQARRKRVAVEAHADPAQAIPETE